MSETRPLVTIGISTYNRADGYLKDALASAVAQTYPKVEIVVSDNCSSDGTEALVKSFSDPRIRYFRQEKNIGANNNFNFCLEQARGEYFLLLHDDDLIDPDFVTACMDALGDGGPVGVIRTGTRVIDDDGNILNQTPNATDGASTVDFFLKWFEGKTALYLCSTLYHTEGLRALGGFGSKTNLFQDVVATVQLAAKMGRVDVFDVKASFRRHAHNFGTAARLHDWCEDSLYLLDMMCQLSADRADEVRRKGLPYLCRKNYRYVAHIRPAHKRLAAYLWVYKLFGYRYSPLQFKFGSYLRGAKRRLHLALQR